MAHKCEIFWQLSISLGQDRVSSRSFVNSIKQELQWHYSIQSESTILLLLPQFCSCVITMQPQQESEIEITNILLLDNIIVHCHQLNTILVTCKLSKVRRTNPISELICYQYIIEMMIMLKLSYSVHIYMYRKK